MKGSALIGFLVLFTVFITGCSKKKVGNNSGANQISQNSDRGENTPPPVVTQRPSKITIAAITDFHGALDSTKTESANKQVVVSGGAGNLAAHIRILRNHQDGPVVLIDGGDLFQGTMESNHFEGRPVIDFYNYLGVKAAALGNHEFDFGPLGEKSVPRDPNDDPRGALKQRILEAKFPILAANVFDETGRTPEWTKPSVVLDVDGVKVGVIGIADENTPSTTNALNLSSLKFLPVISEISREANRLRKWEKVDVVVLTIHAGGACANNDLDKQDDLNSCAFSPTPSSDIIKIVQNLPEGTLDVVVAGHTHRGMAKRIGRTVIMQSFSSGQYLSWAEIDLKDRAAKPEIKGFAEVCGNQLRVEEKGNSYVTCDSSKVKKLSGKTEPATFLGVTVVSDPNVEKLLDPDFNAVRELKNQSLEAESKAEIARSYGEESALGNLIADATKEALPESEIGMANGGGIRANLPAGPLNYGHVFNVLPFDNQIALLKVNGKIILDLIKLGISGKQGALLWSGITFSAKGCDVLEAYANGEAISPVRVYSIATSDYLAQGGSGIKDLKIPADAISVHWDQTDILRDQVAGVIRKWKVLDGASFYNPAIPRQKLDGKCSNP